MGGKSVQKEKGRVSGPRLPWVWTLPEQRRRTANPGLQGVTGANEAGWLEGRATGVRESVGSGIRAVQEMVVRTLAAAAGAGGRSRKPWWPCGQSVERAQ